MGPTWGPPGPCRSQMGPMLATWTLLSGEQFWSTPPGEGVLLLSVIFFNKHGSVAYMLEPLKPASRGADRHRVYIKGVLYSILHCWFHDTKGLKGVDKNWYHEKVFCQLPRHPPGCRRENGIMYVSFEDAEMHCRSMPYIAYQFICFPSIESVGDYTKYCTKVIQLLRDPRGIYIRPFIT